MVFFVVTGGGVIFSGTSGKFSLNAVYMNDMNNSNDLN